MSDLKARAMLAESIQATASTDEELNGAVLMGWVVVAEWMSPAGQRWLSRVDGSASGEGCPAWQVQGYLHNALFEPEGFSREEDEA